MEKTKLQTLFESVGIGLLGADGAFILCKLMGLPSTTVEAMVILLILGLAIYLFKPICQLLAKGLLLLWLLIAIILCGVGCAGTWMYGVLEKIFTPGDRL